jgi:hypothetical protein
MVVLLTYTIGLQVLCTQTAAPQGGAGPCPAGSNKTHRLSLGIASPPRLDRK